MDVRWMLAWETGKTAGNSSSIPTLYLAAREMLSQLSSKVSGIVHRERVPTEKVSDDKYG
jgi:hypothetical protein